MHTIKGQKKCLITGNPIFNEEGEIIKVVTTVQDITELINLKEKLEQSQELTRKYHLELEHLRKQQMQKTNIIEAQNKQYWPGNVRELENLLERLIVIVNERVINNEHLKGLVEEKTPKNYLNFLIEENISLDKALTMLEKQIIDKILKEQGSKRKAAKKLGISQASVVLKAKKYEIY